MPEAVTSFGAVSHDGWLYVCGGHKGERHEYSAPMVSGAFHRLQLADGTAWEYLPDTAPAQGAPLAAHGHHVYRIGGMAARNQPGEMSDLHSRAAVTRYDIRRGVWEGFVPLPEPGSSHGAVVLGGSLYVVGGWTLAGTSVKASGSTRFSRSIFAPPDRDGKSCRNRSKGVALALAGVADRLYCVGGMDSQGDTFLAVDVFNTRNGSGREDPTSHLDR